MHLLARVDYLLIHHCPFSQDRARIWIVLGRIVLILMVHRIHRTALSLVTISVALSAGELK